MPVGKLKTQSSKLKRNPKLQAPNRARVLSAVGAWDLELLLNFEL
jgi:hypothetical protein